MFANKLVAKAMEYAAKAHRGGYRKGGDVPYIVHPFEVAMILKENAFEDKIIAAGLLHDLLEDTEVTRIDLKEEFDEEILELVLSASEELPGREERSWDLRKNHTIDYLQKEASFINKAICCADKLSNARSILRDLEKESEGFWQRFSAPKKKQQWYYESLVVSLKELEGLKMYGEFKEVVSEIFK
ncbi:HD domain-containing protein [Halanaerobium saccharolyticum]|uniref:HD domain-containing protein n=1 Tax=Halanaerobium saccharolyticum TaxID=43595 RepID=A0A4R7YMP1_9FIRM|nr:HD domain-containing protein [Halanaerobium saccharolyticum]RAK05044.1 HD domain-containing protein [Halanaerobium saccharolyticum]TDV98830.1 HD domain-containing protein [Halanaerobium saccharolyticum]TDX51481.1 HD domain-containing protein [Halanaerobium saccharolyticum]